MPRYYVNGRTVLFDESSILLDAYALVQQCGALNIKIPRFCFHEHLSIAGNCRMCVIEIQGVAKPALACSTEVVTGVGIYTTGTIVKLLREEMLELLLINHPLDCPICDQGGECDLQEHLKVFGSDTSRFAEEKRGVSDKLGQFGPLLKISMTRCVHCTRCVRFYDEIVGVSLFGTTGRGSATFLSTYSVSDSVSSM